MRHDSLLLGMDSGTQSSTACAWSLSGRLVARASAPQAVRTPRRGWAEQDPRAWWRTARRALRSLARRIAPSRIAALGIAFQRETFTLADRHGRFLRPGILWLDVRAADEARSLARSLGARRFHRRTGKPLDVTCALPRLRWLRRHEPRVLRSAARWVDVGAALARALTGRYATCVSGADTCGLVDLRRRDWIDDYIRAAGMKREQFPDLVEPGARIGALTPEAARETGLPSGLPVVAAGGDGQVFSLGMGAVAAGALSLTLGTSVILGMVSARPAVSPVYRTLLLQPGRYLLECVLQSGTYLLKWFLRAMDGGEHDEDYWDRRAAAVPAGSEGLITLPHWWGVRFPESLPHARGLSAGWGNHHTRDHFYRSLLEGSAFELKRALDEYARSFPGQVGDAVHAGGGGMRSPVWSRILADTLGRPLRPAAQPGAVTLGAAILAGTGVGIFPSPAAACRRMCRSARPVTPDARRVLLYDRLFRNAYLPLLTAAAGDAAGDRRGT